MSRPLNRLANEKSPYLLQHAVNPVDWYPWGDEAFEKARREDRPIFLSIGYSTCHWCHVMERESFEDEAVANLLNRHFVPVKLDREERPDVDRVYMTAMQLMGAGGGWPLNVFLTPALEPFYGGTYFPPRSMHGRIGMLELLPSIHDAWMQRRAEVVQQGGRIVEALTTLTAREGAGDAARQVLIERAVESLARTEDTAHGGFGTEPKFPQPVHIELLFHEYARDPARHRDALDMALRQLDAMQAGGIHDRLGGGFHRYSTDRRWLVPHFEKMLYDQAQLASAYVAAWQLTGRAAYAAAARGIFDYVRRDLSSPEGAFYSAEDADSEGEEGRFYVWTPEQLAAELSAEDATLFAAYYDVTPHGNFEHGASILHTPRPLADVARAHGVTIDDAAARLERARATLFAARERRVRPHRDDKVLAAWNGLMIAAFARGARAFGDATLLAAARAAAEFLWTRLFGAGGELRRRWRDGEAAMPGQLDDYAYVAYGYIDLYRASLDPVWLERAVALTATMIERFADTAQGGFFESPAGDPHVPVRLKDDYDGAENSGASIAAMNLLVLGRLLDRGAWLELAERTLDFHARRIESHPLAMAQMLVAMGLAAGEPRHVVVAGRRDAADTRALLAEYARRYLSDDILLLVDDAESRGRVAALAPFCAALEPRDGHATAYVCIRYACRLPITDTAAFAAQLDELAPARTPMGAPV